MYSGDLKFRLVQILNGQIEVFGPVLFEQWVLQLKLKPHHLKSELHKVWISNGQISDPHCTQILSLLFSVLQHRNFLTIFPVHLWLSYPFNPVWFYSVTASFVKAHVVTIVIVPLLLGAIHKCYSFVKYKSISLNCFIKIIKSAPKQKR